MRPSKTRKAGKLTVYDQKGRMAGECRLPTEIFYARVNHRLLLEVQTAYAARRRRGTASTKTRSEVRGGGTKPWRQKGTGRARTGSIRAPQWRGGGVVFGPHPKDYDFHIPVQLKRQALISALSLKLAEGKVVLVDSVSLRKPKTKELVQVVKALKLDDHPTLCVLSKPDERVTRAARNLKYCLRLESVKDCSAYDVLKNDRLLLEQKAIPALEERLLGSVSKAAVATGGGGERL